MHIIERWWINYNKGGFEMNELFYNKRFINQREQKLQDKEQKMMELQKRVKKVQLKFSNQTNQSKEKADFEELYKMELKKNRDLMKREKLLKQKNHIIINDLKDCKDKLRILKQRNMYVYTDNVNLRKENKTLNHNKDILKVKIKNIKHELMQLEYNNNFDKNTWKLEKKTLLSKIQSYKDKYLNLLNDDRIVNNEKLEKIVTDKNSLSQRIETLNVTINRLNQELISMYRKSKINKNSASKLLDKLDNYIDIENYYIHRDKINIFVQHVMKIESILWKKQFGLVESNFDFICGLISNFNRKIMFKDFSGEYYSIENADQLQIPSQTHVFCNAEIIGEKNVKILQFISPRTIKKENQEKHILIPTSNFQNDHPSTVYDFNNDISVLLLTGKGTIGKAYRNYLRHMKIKASWINPFEKGKSSVNLIMQRADIVILFSDAMPHALLDFIDKGAKFQIMTTYNYKMLYNRVRYAALQLNLK
jgi:hypothetical protein